MRYNIDLCEEMDKYYFIQGWAFDDAGNQVDITANTGCSLKRIHRYDVAAVFSDITVNELCGFELKVNKGILQRFKGTKMIIKSKEQILEVSLPIVTEETLESVQEVEITYQPKISIVIPVYNTPESYFQELIDSIRKQSYDNWELCLADGGSEKKFIEYLNTFESNKIHIKRLGKNLGIAGNTNEAIRIASGDYIAFCDHDDCLAEDALLEVVKAINANNVPDFVYTDEDKMTMDSSRFFQPNHKSDFNMKLLEVGNYLNHLSVIKKDFLFQIGLLNSEYDGSQDYDLVLRVAENTEKITHVKKILYHWRCHENSVADNPDSKKYAFDSAVRALKAHFIRMGEDVEVVKSDMIGSYKIIRK